MWSWWNVLKRWKNKPYKKKVSFLTTISMEQEFQKALFHLWMHIPFKNTIKDYRFIGSIHDRILEYLFYYSTVKNLYFVNSRIVNISIPAEKYEMQDMSSTVNSGQMTV